MTEETKEVLVEGEVENTEVVEEAPAPVEEGETTE